MAPWARAGGHGFRGAPAAELLWPCGRLEGWRGAAPAPRVGRGGRRLLRALPAGARTMPGNPGGGGSSGHRRLRVPHLPVPGHGALDGVPWGLTCAGFGVRPTPEAPCPAPGARRPERGAAARAGGRTGRWRWRGPRSGSSRNAEPRALPALFKESPDVSRAGPPSPRPALGPGPPPSPPVSCPSQGRATAGPPRAGRSLSELGLARHLLLPEAERPHHPQGWEPRSRLRQHPDPGADASTLH